MLAVPRQYLVPVVIATCGIAFSFGLVDQALASTLSWNGDDLPTITYNASPGERNNVIYNGATIVDFGATIHAQAPCHSQGPHIASCPGGKGILNLGGLKDRLRVGSVGCTYYSRSPVAFIATLGKGNDSYDGRLGYEDNSYGFVANFPNGGLPIYLGNCQSDIYGNEGNDVLLGGAGPEYLDGGPGTDRCDGNRGQDTEVNCEVVDHP